MTTPTVVDPNLATVAEVATYLTCSDDHVRRLITTRQIGHVRIGRLVRIPWSEAHRIAKEGTR